MEPTRRDFPFQDGAFGTPSAFRWALALAAVAAGFAALLCGPHLFGADQPLPGVLLFVGLPLAGLAVLTRGRLGLVFARPTLRDVGVGVGFGLLNLVVTAVIGWLVTRWLQTAANPVGDTLAALANNDLAAFFGLTGLQLVGEELVTVIPFLAVLTLVRRAGGGRALSVGVAAVAAALLFAAMHFPTYHWHVLQTVLIIGSARLVLLGAYLTTKTLWASVIAHILNDWTLFALVLLALRAMG
jgi:membrane protease YdiL (CAAX protease family)